MNPSRSNRWASPRLTVSASLVFLFLLATFPSESLGQQRRFSGDPVWFSGPANLTLITALGDVDGDGDLDLVCANGSVDRSQVCVLYLNEGGSFSSIPAWTSDQYHPAFCVSLGDVDGDGDLDLVAGGIEGAMLYRNLGGAFEDTPSWSPRGEETHAIALGDVDNDGDLDLVCGTYRTGNTMYRNVDGAFEDTPAWVSQDTHAYRTRALDLGDIDGDGFIDLVCGNGLATGNNTVYLNVGGVFDTAPAWISTPVHYTYGVALGDLDGDGDLDLVCANRDSSNTFYRNVDGMLETEPSLAWAASDLSKSVTLGDEDGDGDLDVVFGNFGTPDRLYENVGGNIDTTSVWASGRSDDTNSVLFGDVDGDGELDLVCGNSSQANTVYRNVGGPFEAVASWSGLPSFRVVLGDVDGDGDLDLVSAGGSYGPNTLYLNEGGVLDTTAVWFSGGDGSRTVALGDIDGDGNLDLVCGNQYRPNTLYLNQGFGTVFPDSALPLSSSSDTTLDIVLGDVDLDGDLDLVSLHPIPGTGTGGGLYLNKGGVIDSVSCWTGEEWGDFIVAKLGDVDGDGDLDLVCAGISHKALYLNSGGCFETHPAWSQSPPRLDWTVAIALADVDGDGDLDLLCGNHDFASTLYRNTGGRFEDEPVFSWGTGASGLSLGDVDQDGDLDVASGPSPTYYRNVGGRFEAPPAWSGQFTSGGAGVVLGDLDGDSDLDLVCSGNPSTAYRNLGHSSRKMNPLAPTHQLPNNPAMLTGTRVEDLDDRYKRIHFTVSDVESDPVRVFLEFQFEGAATWFPAEGDAFSGVTDLLASSPAGLAYSLDWDISRIPFDRRDVVLRLRAVEVPARVSRMQSTDSRVVHVGAVVPLRPELTLSSTVLSFEPSVTVGDTLAKVLALSNTGTEPLLVTQITSPSSELLVDPPAPYDIPPGEQELATLLLVPREQTNISGQMQVSSNDPLEPVATIEIESSIRALEITSQLLAQTDSIPLGEAVTVIVTPAPEVRVERGFLYFRPSGGAGAFPDSISLSPSGGDFIAVIPSEKVTEVGLDYYVRVENSGLFHTDPDGAPESFFTRPVRQPTAFSVEAIPDPGGDYLENRDIDVRVTLPEGAEFVSGVLHYRPGGGHTYEGQSLGTMDGILGASIPGLEVGARGIEYWVEVETQTTEGHSLTVPPTDPAETPRSLQIKVQNLVEPSTWTGGTYRMFSIPLEVYSESIGNLLVDQFGPYNPTVWRAFRYVPDRADYVELSDPSASAHFQPEPGKAFWLISSADHRIDTAPVDCRSTPTDRTYAILLPHGWSQVGDPFAFPVAWSDVLAASGISSADTLLEIREWIPNSSGGGRYNTDEEEIVALEPFEGYFVKNNGTSNLLLRVPPVEGDAPRLGSLAGSDEAIDGWRVNIAASVADVEDPWNAAGVSPAASPGRDSWDRSEPPETPGSFLSLYFPTPGTGRLSADIRPWPQGTEVSGQEWRFDVARGLEEGDSPGEVELRVTGTEDVPRDLSLVLIDCALGRSVDLRETPEYSYVSGDRAYQSFEDARFRLLVGTKEYVESGREALPARTRLLQSHPNPFRSGCVIRYELRKAGPVRLRIFDVQGRLVTELRSDPEEAGRYDVVWSGESDSGRTVSPGVYFYRMETSGYAETRKMIRLP